MRGNWLFKIILISLIFSISTLIILPEIPLVSNSSILKLDSKIGGYKVKLNRKGGGKEIDFSAFKMGWGVGENKKLTFKLKEDTDDNAKNLEKNVSIVKNRLSVAGISDFSVYIEDNQLVVVFPEYENENRIGSLVLGNGKVIFRKLKEPDTWNVEDFAKFYMDVNQWDDTDIRESDIESFEYSIGQTGNPQVNIIFTDEGREKFYDLVEDNVNLPIGIYLSDFDYPFLMPVISETLLTRRDLDPFVGSSYPRQTVEDANLQFKMPLDKDLSYGERSSLEPILGYDFLNSFLIAVAVSSLLVGIFMVIKFKSHGFISIMSMFYSVVLFLALSKLLGIPLGLQMIFGLIILIGVIYFSNYILLSDVENNISQGKPFDLAFAHTFGGDREESFVPALALFIVFIISYVVMSSGAAKLFMFTMSVATLSLIVFNLLFFPTLMWCLGGKKK
jgi:preprotein translocase subunit SecD